jgi:hypothetical protein
MVYSEGILFHISMHPQDRTEQRQLPGKTDDDHEFGQCKRMMMRLSRPQQNRTPQFTSYSAT